MSASNQLVSVCRTMAPGRNGNVRHCIVCSHSEREAIDQALVAGRSFRDIEGQWKVSRSALHRHKAHVSDAMVEARAGTVVTNAGSLLDQVHEQIARCHRLATTAETILAGAGSDSKLALRAAEATCKPVRELRGYLELMGEITGEISRRGATAVAVAGAQASAEVSEVEQLRSLTDEELLEELEEAAAQVRERLRAKGA